MLRLVSNNSLQDASRSAYHMRHAAWKEENMGVEFRESETKDNLMRAFAGESQARNRYTFAASQAKQNGLYVISAIFAFTASRERNMRRFFTDI